MVDETEKKEDVSTEVKKIVKDIKKQNKLELKSASRKDKKDIKKNNYKNYDVIYFNYGQDYYNRYVPENVRNKSMSSLVNEGRFIELYEKHGESVYNQYLNYMRSEDVKYETGSSIRAFFNRLKNRILRKYLPTATALTLALPTVSLMASDNYIKENRAQIADKIDEYLEEVEIYGNEVKKYNLTELQNIMLVFDDMWGSIEGYGTPQIDNAACFGLDLSKEYGVGVCRNMADDVARKLNVINPKYNARCMAVYLTEGGYEYLDIERKEVNSETTEEVNEGEENFIDKIFDKVDITKIVGNHMIIIMDSLENDFELVLDPTNLGIGIYKNGKMTMFNSKGEKPFKLECKPTGNFVFGSEYVEGMVESFAKSVGFENIESMRELYGLEKQKEALESAKKIRDEYELKKQNIFFNNKNATVENINKTKNNIVKSKDIEDELER